MHRSVSSEGSLLVLSDNQLESSDAQAFAELGSQHWALVQDMLDKTPSLDNPEF